MGFSMMFFIDKKCLGTAEVFGTSKIAHLSKTNLIRKNNEKEGNFWRSSLYKDGPPWAPQIGAPCAPNWGAHFKNYLHLHPEWWNEFWAHKMKLRTYTNLKIKIWLNFEHYFQSYGDLKLAISNFDSKNSIFFVNFEIQYLSDFEEFCCQILKSNSKNVIFFDDILVIIIFWLEKYFQSNFYTPRKLTLKMYMPFWREQNATQNMF